MKYDGKTLVALGPRQLEALQDIVADGDALLPVDHPAAEVDELIIPRLLATVQARDKEIEQQRKWRAELDQEASRDWERMANLKDALRKLRDGKEVQFNGRSPERQDWTDRKSVV